MGVIDIHTHLLGRGDVTDQRNFEFLEKCGFRIGARPPVSELLAELDKGGIELAVVQGTPPNAGIDGDNDTLARWIAPHPDRLRAFGCVDPFTEKDVLGSVRHCVEDLGFLGVGEFGYCDVADGACDALYEACIRLDVPILIHQGATLPATPMKYGHPNALDEVLVRYPELTVIAAHCGVPWVNELAAVAVRHKNLWIDVAALLAYPLVMRHQALLTMLGAGLGDRLLFGSDFPAAPPAASLRFVKRFQTPLPLRALLAIPKISAAQRHALLEGNARKLLKL